MQSFNEFKSLAEQGEIVPVYMKMLADIETPVSILGRLQDEENLFLLESVEAGEHFGRYSFIGLNPKGIFTIESGVPYYTTKESKMELPHSQGAFMALRELVGKAKVALPADFPPLFAGAIGFLGYDTVRQFEYLPNQKTSSSTIESAFLITDEMIIFDNLKHTLTFSIAVKHSQYPNLKAAYDNAIDRLSNLKKHLEKPLPFYENLVKKSPKLNSNTSKDAYMEMVEKAKQHIFDGDIIQVVLSQKFIAQSEIPPFQLYRALRMVNPSPYTFFLKIGSKTLVGSSPETLVKLEKSLATLRPIAGTRPRGKNTTQDHAFAHELLQDEKERAEHLMLVDLGRNDLGRIALPGSVQVKDFMTVERYSHVMHLVTTVEAMPRPEVDAFELVKATFPAGTLSGAPKVSAMKIIDELEQESRGTYGGAIGYFSCNGNMDLAITIRTISIENHTLSIQAGAGIVYDSDPEKEYQECCNKAAGMVRAIELAVNNFSI